MLMEILETRQVEINISLYLSQIIRSAWDTDEPLCMATVHIPFLCEFLEQVLGDVVESPSMKMFKSSVDMTQRDMG